MKGLVSTRKKHHIKSPGPFLWLWFASHQTKLANIASSVLTELSNSNLFQLSGDLVFLLFIFY